MSDYIYSRYLIGRFSPQTNIVYNTYIQELDLDITEFVSNSVIQLKDAKKTEVITNNIICYGELDLKDAQEIAGIRESKITNVSLIVPSKVNLETGEIGELQFDTMDALRLLINGYVKIGKPKKVIVYHEIETRRSR